MVKLHKDTEFLATVPFQMDFGRMHPTDFQKLMSDILDGRGTVIPEAAGLREIVVESFRGKAGPKWLVVFAVYVKRNLVVLASKERFHSKKKKFNHKQQMELATWKKRLDGAVEAYFKKHK